MVADNQKVNLSYWTVPAVQTNSVRTIQLFLVTLLDTIPSGLLSISTVTAMIPIYASFQIMLEWNWVSVLSPHHQICHCHNERIVPGGEHALRNARADVELRILSIVSGFCYLTNDRPRMCFICWSSSPCATFPILPSKWSKTNRDPYLEEVSY
jgi:hypothetical protein